MSERTVLGPDLIFKDGRIIFKRLPIPVSVNDYCNRRYLTKKANFFDQSFSVWKAANFGKKSVGRIREILFGREFLKYAEREAFMCIPIRYTWIDNWKTKEGRIIIKDITNHIKRIEDSIFEWIGVNDCYVHDMSIRSVQSEKSREFRAELFKPKNFPET